MDNLPEKKTSPSEIFKALSVTDGTWKSASLDFDSILWVGEAKTTKLKWDAKKLELENAFDALSYSRNRASAYPSNGDQWDMIYKDNLNGTTTHKDAVEVVKTKWPKDNSGPV